MELIAHIEAYISTPKQNKPRKDTHSFGCLDADHSNLFQTTCGPVMAKLQRQQTFSHEFQPFQLFLSDNPHCEDAEHFFREFSAGKTNHFSVKYDQRKCKWWKINVFFAGDPLDFISFSAAENHIFFTEAAGLTRLVLSTLSVLSPFLQHQLQAIPVVRKSLLHTGVRPPSCPGGFCHFEVRGVAFFALTILHLDFIYLIRTN